jgi:hypothetical protein
MKTRKLKMVVNHIKLEDEDQLDLHFWRKKKPIERLEEVYRLRKNHFTQKNGFYPKSIEKVVHKRILNV